jgi:RNA polymerase sigma factor (TIGR02999 family)
MSEATRLINAMNQGDRRAAAELLPLVYQELRQLARSRMAEERNGHTLQATALVHEAYLRLIGQDGQSPGFDGRGHFFAAAAEAMRRILIDHVRQKQSLKRGDGWERIAADDLPAIASPCDDIIDLLALDEALQHFAAEHPAEAELIKLVYFAGLTLDETAAALGMAKTTAHRHLAFARAWLQDAMSHGRSESNGTAG